MRYVDNRHLEAKVRRRSSDAQSEAEPTHSHETCRRFAIATTLTTDGIRLSA